MRKTTAAIIVFCIIPALAESQENSIDLPRMVEYVLKNGKPCVDGDLPDMPAFRACATTDVNTGLRRLEIAADIQFEKFDGTLVITCNARFIAIENLDRATWKRPAALNCVPIPPPTFDLRNLLTLLREIVTAFDRQIAK